jgi:hypothetical protein
MTDSYEELGRTRWAAEQTARHSQQAADYNRQTARHASDSSSHAARAADAQEKQARAAQRAVEAQVASAEAHQQMAEAAVQARQDQLNYHFKMWLQTEHGQAYSRWSAMASEFLAGIDRRTSELPGRWIGAWSVARARALPEGVSDMGLFGGQIVGIVMAVLGTLEIARHLSTPKDLLIRGPVSLAFIVGGIAIAVWGARRERARRNVWVPRISSGCPEQEIRGMDPGDQTGPWTRARNGQAFLRPSRARAMRTNSPLCLCSGFRTGSTSLFEW